MSIAVAQKKSESTVAGAQARVSLATPNIDTVTPAEIRLIQSKSSCACGGGCPNCQTEDLNIQPKLRISQPNDLYEQEADRVADQVMRMPDLQVQRQVSTEEEEEEALQTKATPGHTNQLISDVSGKIQGLNGGGQPLSKSSRSFFEPRFGHDFKQVRIHTGPNNAKLAQDINARAFTLGNNIVFGSNQYAPESNAGKKLLAHELTHVVQQTRSRAHAAAPQSRGAVSEPRTLHAAPLQIARLLPPQSDFWWRHRPSPIGQQLAHLRTTGCSASQNSVIQIALPEAHRRVGKTIDALRIAIRPILSGTTLGQLAERALRFTFKSTDNAVVNHILDRFIQAENMLLRLMSIRTSFFTGGRHTPTSGPRLECHDAIRDPTCARGVAYVSAMRPGRTSRESIVFCPNFYGAQDRSGIIVHEILHALGLGENIGDRGYSHNRYYPNLTTEEALTNADSYRVFMLHVTSGRTPHVRRLYRDILAGCDVRQSLTLDRAFSRVQQWLSVAERRTVDRRRAWLALRYWRDLRKRYLGGLAVALIDRAKTTYQNVQGQLWIMVEARCHPQANTTCPTGTPTATLPGMMGPELQVCPGWFAVLVADERAFLILAEMLQGPGVTTRQQRINLARMAVTLFDDLGTAPDLDRILGRPPKGDFPEPDPNQPTRIA